MCIAALLLLGASMHVHDRRERTAASEASGLATLGNLAWLGWTCVITAGLSVLVALATFGGEEKGSWAKHSVFFIPVVFWPLILGAVGGRGV